MKHSLRKLSHNGDDVVAEWDPKTVSPARLNEIESEFNALQAKGYFAADITDGRNVLVKRFDPNADLLMLPRVQGG
jgi:hypothetical protein